MLYGGLLLLGQVIVRYVRAADIVLLDDVLPRVLRALVGEIKVLDVVVLQPCIFLGSVAERLAARTAPGAPNVEQHELALERLEDFLQHLTLAEVCEVVRRLEHQLVELPVLDGEIVVVFLTQFDDCYMML